MTALLHAPKARRADAPPAPGFLEAVRRSGVLSDSQLVKVRGRVDSGRYPRDPLGLAEALVAAGMLTPYQAGRLLRDDFPTLVVGSYVILDRLGRGSMGRVYKARHRLMGRVVALKVVDPEVARTPGAAARFRREVRIAGLMDHPHVVRAFDAGRVGRDLYLVMEYLPGRGLDELLAERGALPPDEAVGYAAQAALGLAHAHALGVVHRDVKPANLRLDGSGRLKVLDFGIGALAEGRDGGRRARRDGDGLAVGTVAYMSPEQARGLAADGRSDLFSLGCVLYHLLTGRVPFPAGSKLACLARRVAGPPDPLSEVAPGLAPGLVAVVDRLTALRPEGRYPGAAEAAEALLGLSGPARHPA